jgi:hypothetical protein
MPRGCSAALRNRPTSANSAQKDAATIRHSRERGMIGKLLFFGSWAAISLILIWWQDRSKRKKEK